jgi:GNAT superfamily N-acetyltransferase
MAPVTAASTERVAAMGEISILRAGEVHLNLARQAIAEVHGRKAVEDTAIIEFLSDKERYLLLALEGDRIAGSLTGHALRQPHRREPQFLLYEIDVRPERRKRGIGRALVQTFIDEARDRGAFEVWVLTNLSNDAARRLYASCGFHRENQDDLMLNLMLNG